jgi:hypothetical protein
MKERVPEAERPGVRLRPEDLYDDWNDPEVDAAYENLGTGAGPAEGPEARVEAALKDFGDSVAAALRRLERRFLTALAACLALQNAVLALMLWWLWRRCAG